MIGFLLYITFILIVIISVKYDEELKHCEVSWKLFMAFMPIINTSVCIIEIYKLLKFLCKK